MLQNLGSAELIIIGVILLVFFGSKKLNELARGLGEATKEVKKLKFTDDGEPKGGADTKE